MNTHLFTAVLLLLSLLSQAQNSPVKAKKALLLGTWLIEEKRQLIIEANDSLRMIADGEVRKSGTWRLNEQADVFYILEQGKIIDEMRILHLTQDEFEFESNKKKIILLKMGNRSRADALHKPFLGRWMENENTFIVLEENGEAYRVENFLQQGPSIVWRISPEQKQMHLYTRKTQVEEWLGIEKITPKELVIITPVGERVVFYREQGEAFSATERQKLLREGQWKEISSSSDLQLQFLPEGKLRAVVDGETTEGGLWAMSSDAVFLALQLPQQEGIEHMRILSLSASLLVLQHAQATMRFQKAP
ncbi:MAG: hypothetical protein HC912_11450 [Saprospiraceae bacterium]|nr:hypothetical protein [Saprospiraceae bacterium]